MVSVNKQEAAMIRSRFPACHIRRTVKQKSRRHRYVCSEMPSVIAFLNRIRKDGRRPKKKGE